MQTLRLYPCSSNGQLRVNATRGRCRLPHLINPRPSTPAATVAATRNNAISSKSATEYPVEVRLYNIDRYGMKNLAPAVLKKKLDAIWHASITAYGSEYWFDHKINCENLQDVEHAFGFGPTHVFHLGSTAISQEEFEAWLSDVMNERYSLDKYDFQRRNCHHFANELALHLTGNGIPEWCLRHGEDALSELDKSDVEKIRWASNKVARVMMVTWGRFNKARFVRKKKLDQGKMRASEMPA